jgi:hypothetical protein
MQDFFRCQAGFEDMADVVATKCCRKLVTDMHYEARVQAIVSYYGTILGQRITKVQARTVTLTQEQYLQVNDSLLMSSSNINLLIHFFLMLCR